MKKFLLKSTLFLVGLVFILFVCGLALWIWNPNQAVIHLQPSGPGRSLDDPIDLVAYLVLQVRVRDLKTPLNTETTTVPFTVEAGQPAIIIGQSLVEKGLIKDARLFQLLLRYNDMATSIEAGDYLLRRNMTLREIALTLQKAPPKDLLVTIPEGWRLEQIAAYLTEKNIMDGEAFLVAAQAGQTVAHPLLASRPPGQSYEGYLFPDTYRLPLNARPEDLIGRMLTNMARKLPLDVETRAAARGYTLYQILTVAAIIEREAIVPEERPLIASVYWNRIETDYTGGYLEADPTIQYALGYNQETGEWWKTPVTLAEYQLIDSPYNTYRHPGLPPGPIANPGLEAIMAALEPAETDFYYFVCRHPGCADGEHIFSTTYEEHLENARRYWGTTD